MSDLTANAVIGQAALLAPILAWRNTLGLMIAPETVNLLARSIRSLLVRVRAHCLSRGFSRVDRPGYREVTGIALAVQANRAATHRPTAAATALTARMLIRRTTARPGCAGVVRYGAVTLFGLARSDDAWLRLGRIPEKWPRQPRP